MKIALWGSLLLCSAAFAQDTPYNPAAEALKKRFQELNLVNPPKPVNPPATSTTPQVVVRASAPKICAVPLLNALPTSPSANIAAPKADYFKMPVVKPNFAGQSKDFATLPVPPCEQ